MEVGEEEEEEEEGAKVVEERAGVEAVRYGDGGNAAATRSLMAVVGQMLALDIRSGAAAARASKRCFPAGGESAAPPAAGAVAVAAGSKELCFNFDGLQFLFRERDGGFEVFAAKAKEK